MRADEHFSRQTRHEQGKINYAGGQSVKVDFSELPEGFAV
jgi:hypothetical protein